jgi:radical SAM protein with 4Fe4S-binding SPASM domain
MNGLMFVNVELTSKCNKDCWICGRRERDKKLGATNNFKYGNMEFFMVYKIASQIPRGTIVQLHNNGEPLLYPYFGHALALFQHCRTGIVTNGKLLVEKADEIIGCLDCLSVSIFENDPEQQEQYLILNEFLKLKKERKPYVTLRFIGNVDEKKYEHFNLQPVHRVIHKPKGSIDYKYEPPVPEIGVCWDLLTHLSIDRHGNISPCVRFDPNGELCLGNIQDISLKDVWFGEKRKKLLNAQFSGKRNELPYCGKKCEYWGIPVDNRKG